MHSGQESKELALPGSPFPRRRLLKGMGGLALAAGIPTVLAACGGGDNKSTTSPTVVGTSGTAEASPTTGGLDPAEVGKKKIAVVAISMGSEGNTRMVNGLKAEAAKGGWEVQLTDGQGDLNAMQSAWQNYIQSGVDGLVTVSTDLRLWDAGIKQAQDANLPYISMFGGYRPGATADIQSDSLAAGAMLGTYVADRLGGKGNVVIINTQVARGTVLREKGFRAALEPYPDIKIIENHDVKVPGWTDDAYATMQTWLQKYSKGEIQAEFSGWDEPAVAAAQAVKAAGRNEIFCLGTDGGSPGLDMIRKQDPFVATTGESFEAIGAGVVRQLALVFSGKPPDGRQLYVHAPLVDFRNVPASGGFQGPLEVYSLWPVENPYGV